MGEAAIGVLVTAFALALTCAVLITLRRRLKAAGFFKGSLVSLSVFICAATITGMGGAVLCVHFGDSHVRDTIVAAEAATIAGQGDLTAYADYSDRNALLFARAADLVYLSRADAIRKIGALGFALDQVRFIPQSGDSQIAIVLADERSVIIAFRGTQERRDLIADAKAIPSLHAKGLVHSGFAGALNALLPDLIRAKSDLSPADRPVWFTGHSLGGAIAALAAVEFAAQGQTVAGVYTFGQPAVGDTAFASHLEQLLAGRYFRIVNNIDAIPDIAVPYRHAGELRYVDRRGTMYRGRAPECIALLDRVLATGQQGGDLGAHRMTGYVSSLEKHVRH